MMTASRQQQEQVQMDLNSFKFDLIRKSSINVIVGSINSGKTALLFRLAEFLHFNSERPVVVFGGSSRIGSLLPVWISQVSDIKKIPAGAHILVDESTQQFFSRQSFSKENVELSKFLAVVRHHDCSMYITTQLLSLLDLSSFRFGALNFWVKRISSFSLRFERPEVASNLKAVVSMLNQVSVVHNMLIQRVACVFNDDFLSLFEHDLPDFWSDRLSKSWGSI